MPATPTGTPNIGAREKRKAKLARKIERRRARQEEKAAAARAQQEANSTALVERKLSLSPAERADVEKRLMHYRRDVLWDRPVKGGRKTARQDQGNYDLVEDQAADMPDAYKVYRNIANDPIEWLFNRASLSQRQHEAAQRLRRDAEAAEIGSNRAAPITGDRVQGGAAPGTLSDRQMDALRRKTLCLETLGTVGKVLVMAVVIDCRPLKDVGERLGMGPHYRAPRLAEALDGVGDFYRL